MKGRLDLDEFDILQEFKGNSCNKIYLVKKKGSSQRLIFKVIKIYNFQSQLREIQAQKNLKHKFIVRLLDYEIQHQNIVLLIEFAEKGDLFEFINTIDSIRESKLLRLFYKIVMAVHFIHLNGFIHRDIKPENILIGGDMEPKLADFGSSVSEEIIRNTFCGTYEYMAPEIYMRRKQTAKVDVWALGVLLYEMTHNSTPFKNKDVMEIKKIVENDKINFDEQISTKIRNVIRSILKFDSEQRPSTAQILKFPGLKRFYEEMKPDLISMYENKSIAKLRKIKSMSNGFKKESNYRHLQTVKNFDQVSNNRLNEKKTSNELKRFSKDLSKSILKNGLTGKVTSIANPSSKKIQEIPLHKIEDIPEEDRPNMLPVFKKNMTSLKALQSSPRMKEGSNSKDRSTSNFRVSIDREGLNIPKTSFDRINEIINDVPYKNSKPTNKIKDRSALFKKHFQTGPYESVSKKEIEKRHQLKSVNKNSRKKNSQNKVLQSNLSYIKNHNHKIVQNEKIYASAALRSMKLDPTSRKKINSGKSITNKIKSLLDKGKKQVNAKIKNTNISRNKLVKIHSEELVRKMPLKSFKKNNLMTVMEGDQSRQLIKDNLLRGNFSVKRNYFSGHNGFQSVLQSNPRTMQSMKNPSLKDKSGHSSKKASNGNSSKLEQTKLKPLGKNSRKQKNKVDSSHFKEFDSKFALKVGFSKYQQKLKGFSGSHRELKQLQSNKAKKKFKTRFSGIGDSLLASKIITSNRRIKKLMKDFGSNNTSVSTSINNQNDKNKKQTNINNKNSHKRMVKNRMGNFSSVIGGNKSDLSFNKLINSRINKNKINPKSDNIFKRLMMSNKPKRKKKPVINYLPSYKAKIFATQDGTVSSPNHSNFKGHLLTKNNSILLKLSGKNSEPKYSGRSKKINIKNNTDKHGNGSTRDPETTENLNSQRLIEKDNKNFGGVQQYLSYQNDKNSNALSNLHQNWKVGSAKKVNKSKEYFESNNGQKVNTETLFAKESGKGYFTNNFF